jgi:hypothetical protein
MSLSFFGGKMTLNEPAIGDGNGTLATKSYVDGAITALVNGAPIALNTLNELAEALGDNANFSATVINNLDTKAPIHDPTFTGTVGGISKDMVGLGNVDNRSDADKPVSTAQQTALNAKASLSGATFTGTVGGISKGMVGLGDVDNTSDLAKPVSTAQQTALNAKASLSGATFTGTVGGITKSMVGLTNVDDTSDLAKPVSTAQQTALNAKASLISPALTGSPTAPSPASYTSTTQLATAEYVRNEINKLAFSPDMLWSQLGQDIDGETAGDQSGYSVSMSADGRTVAISSRNNAGNVSYSGHCRVYSYNSGSWSQLGQDIDGEAESDFSGRSVSLSADGRTVAIGSTTNAGNGTESGHCRVYSYISANAPNHWTPLGQDIDGEAEYDQSGHSVSLSSDGRTVAIGVPSAYYIQYTAQTGQCRVYSYNSGTLSWTKLGQNIYGEANGNQSGWSVSMSDDGRTVAIGAIWNADNGYRSGQCRIYSYNSTTLSWSQLGQEIDGEAEGDRSGYSVSMSADGRTVAIGAYGNDGAGNAKPNSGHCRVYSYNSANTPTHWTQLGQDIDGEADSDLSGFSVSMSADGRTVAIGAPDNAGANGAYSGHCRVYYYNSGNSTWIKLGQDIDGEAYDDGLGYSVSMSADGRTVAIGAIYNAGAGAASGHCRVYQLPVIGTAGATGSAGAKGDTGATGSAGAKGDTGATGAKGDTGATGSAGANGDTGAAGAKGDTGATGSVSLASPALTGSPTAPSPASYTSTTQLATAEYVRNEINKLAFSPDMLWSQLGQDIDGEAEGDRSGWSVSMSADGRTVAIGAYGNDGAGVNSGHCRVYSYISGTWTQLGLDIDGESSSDQSGYSVSMSADGRTVAIGANYNAGNGSYRGHCRVYSYNSNTWTQLGQDIDGEANSDFSGKSVSMSADGRTVAIGAYSNDGAGDAKPDSGHCRVYTYISANAPNPWTKLGQDIDGEVAGDNSGMPVSMSADGRTVAIGANANAGNGSTQGHCRVYSYNSGTLSWEPLGQDIDGEANFDFSCGSVSMSADGRTVAIGATNNAGNGSYRGHCRVYNYNSGTLSWSKLGQDIDGEANFDFSGWSVSMSADGRTVAICSINNADAGADSGHCRVYYYNSGTGTWTKLGLDIDGESAGDQSGYSVSMSADGRTVAIGANLNDGSGNAKPNSGHCRVYQLPVIGQSNMTMTNSIVPVNPVNGTTFYDTANNRLGLFYNGVWRYVTMV